MSSNVLVITDDTRDISGLRSLLSTINLDVIFTSGQSFLADLESDQQFLLIVLDIDLEDRNGFDILRELNLVSQARSRLPIFLVASTLSRKDEIQAYEYGVVDIFYRPLIPEIFLRKLSFFLKQHVLTHESHDKAPSHPFFDGSGELHRFFREKDWSVTALGPLESWPQSLRTAVSIMLDSKFPMVIAWGKERIFLYNESYIPILGKKHPSAFGEPFEEVWADVWDTVGPLVKSVDEGKSIYAEDLSLHTTRNGIDETFYATFSYSPIRDELNQVAGLFCVVVETTSRKQSEDALKISESGLIDTLESMSDAFVSLDKDWHVTHVNNRLEIMSQKKREDQIGKSFIDLWFSKPNKERSFYLESYRKAMAERVGVTFLDYYEPLKLWTEVRVHPKQDGGLTIFYTDISERKQNELLAANAKIKFEQSVDMSPAILWITERDGSCTYLSKQWYEFTGQTEEEALGFGWLDATHPDDKARAERTFTQANKNQEPFYTEYRLRTKAGDYRWAIDAGNPRFDENGQYLGYAGTVFDIHERKNAEVEIKKSKDDADHAREESERANSLKSSFLANMSHEIRTPLGAILGFSNMLKDSAIVGPERDQYLETILRNGYSLTRIIDDILDLAKVEAGKLDLEEVAFSLKSVVTEALDLFRDKAREKGIYLLLNMEESVPLQISSDPTRIRQILVNLIGNAVKFTATGGILLNVRASSLASGKIKVFIEVKDTGIGLSQEQKERLFTPFNQADNSMTRKFGGTGLGLALSQRLSQALSGEISIPESTLGKGCTFALDFIAGVPANQTPIKAKPVRSSESKKISLEGLRVLIVDDSADNQLLAARILTKTGAEVDTASDGEEGVAKALEGTFDVILMDIQMPKLDGYQAKEELDRRGYQKPVIALTAHAMADERDKTKAAGFVGHLTKPIDARELLKAVEFYGG